MQARTRRRKQPDLIQVVVKGTDDPSEAERVFAREINGSFPDGRYTVEVVTTHKVIFTEVRD